MRGTPIWVVDGSISWVDSVNRPPLGVSKADISLRQRVNAWNVSFKILERWQIYIID